MKKVISAITAMSAIFAATICFALPHDNRSDVKTTVKEFIPYSQFSIINDLSLGAGTPSVAEVASQKVAGIKMATTTSDVHILLPIPENLCVDCPIKVSILWATSSSTTTSTATWKVLYNAYALSEPLQPANTALNTPITSDSVLGTAYDFNETPQGVINSSVLSRSDILHILVGIDSTSGLNLTTNSGYFLGMYFEYVRELL